jgi:competence protein ComGC
MLKLIKNKKGIELTIQLIVIIIISLAVLIFILVFLTGQGDKVTALWENITVGSIESAAAQ